MNRNLILAALMFFAGCNVPSAPENVTMLPGGDIAVTCHNLTVHVFPDADNVRVLCDGRQVDFNGVALGDTQVGCPDLDDDAFVVEWPGFCDEPETPSRD